MSGFVVVVFMRFLMDAREGIITNQCFDSRLREEAPAVEAPLIPGAAPLVSSLYLNTGVFILLPAPMIDAILFFSAFDLVARSLFDAGRSPTYMYRSREVK